MLYDVKFGKEYMLITAVPIEINTGFWLILTRVRIGLNCTSQSLLLLNSPLLHYEILRSWIC